MKIAILGAMEEEIKPLIDFFSANGEVVKEEYAKNIFYKTQFKGIDLVIANSKIGKVHAALTATVLVEKYGCEKMLFTGVAGGLNPSLNIGDIIFATSLCQHDVDITAFGHEPGFIPGSTTFIETCPHLLGVAREIATQKGLTVLEGCVATGDQFIHSTEKKDFLISQFNADAIEMEGSAVAVVCNALDIPLFLLRSISDVADMDANFNFAEFLETATKNSSDFIISLLEGLSKS